MKTLPHSTPVLVVGLALLILLTTTGGAVAGSLITSKQIKNGTITSVDIKDGGIARKDLARSARGIAGPAGPKGSAGVAGPRGFSAWDTIPSGVTVTGSIIHDGSTTGSTDTDVLSHDLPGVAPVPLLPETVNFGASPSVSSDVDPACAGSFAAPTAPAGKLCVYVGARSGLTAPAVGVGTLADRTFYVRWEPVAGAGTDMWITLTWAYTAP